jgi:hypothetical protein
MSIENDFTYGLQGVMSVIDANVPFRPVSYAPGTTSPMTGKRATLIADSNGLQQQQQQSGSASAPAPR